MINKSLLGGKVFQKQLGNWNVTWESDRNYRFWCRQSKLNKEFEKDLLIVMLNPGSLMGCGERLTSDKTLEVLREVFRFIHYNCLVTNLFDYSDTQPGELFENWDKRNRDEKTNVYEKLDYKNIVAYIFAYGDNGSHNDLLIDSDLRKRIKKIKSYLKDIPQVPFIENINGTPKHPLAWRRQKLTTKMTARILKILKEI